MKNFEKYKTAEARAGAYNKYCNSKECSECQLNKLNKPYGVDCCMAFWLDLEAEEEKPLPCPFCGSECELHEIRDKGECKSAGYDVRCTMCEYRSPMACKYDGSDAIAAHNRVAKAVIQITKENENECENHAER